jgi:hypothetical protein
VLLPAAIPRPPLFLAYLLITGPQDRFANQPAALSAVLNLRKASGHLWSQTAPWAKEPASSNGVKSFQVRRMSPCLTFLPPFTISSLWLSAGSSSTPCGSLNRRQSARCKRERPCGPPPRTRPSCPIRLSATLGSLAGFPKGRPRSGGVTLSRGGRRRLGGSESSLQDRALLLHGNERMRRSNEPRSSRLTGAAPREPSRSSTSRARIPESYAPCGAAAPGRAA